MDSALWAAKTGLEAQQTRMTVTANNLANVNTTGFKRSRVAFEDLMYQTVRQTGATGAQDTLLPSGVHLGTGSRVVATEKLNTQGSIQITNNSTDVAINGRGFFQVSLPDGTTAYTRDGSFKLNAEGELVTSGGYRVQPAISIPEGAISVTVGTDGAVSVQLQGQAAPNQVGTLQLADFINPAGMQARGENLLLETAASGPPQAGTPGVNGLGSLQQGALEASNVNVVEELVSMIETQRAYEMNSKAISTTDKMLEYLTQRL
ncbi:MAG: flagellar basal body rod protein FlgG [Pseudomonadota bacterium]|jgi:flagellar basal-body rod protein FlgG